MKSQEEIRSIAKRRLIRSFRLTDNGNDSLADKYEAQYNILCHILELSDKEMDELWDEAQKAYEGR